MGQILVNWPKSQRAYATALLAVRDVCSGMASDLSSRLSLDGKSQDMEADCQVLQTAMELHSLLSQTLWEKSITREREQWEVELAKRRSPPPSFSEWAPILGDAWMALWSLYENLEAVQKLTRRLLQLQKDVMGWGDTPDIKLSEEMPED